MASKVTKIAFPERGPPKRRLPCALDFAAELHTRHIHGAGCEGAAIHGRRPCGLALLSPVLGAHYGVEISLAPEDLQSSSAVQHSPSETKLKLTVLHTLYADDTYAKSSKEDREGRIHIFGGIEVNKESEATIINVIREIKSRYTHPNMPIKWNFRDTRIRKKFDEFDRLEEYEAMLAASREWRMELFRRLNSIDYKVVVSCIEAMSEDKTVVADLKDRLNTYCFENVLMRVGLDARDLGGYWHCVIDWPPDNDTKPFDRGYYRLFHFGQGASPNAALCGPLEKVGFSHSLHYSRANHSPLLQLADLILGAIRDHVECRLQGRGSCVGTECVEIFYDHFRNKRGTVPRYGVSVSTRNQSLANQVNEIFRRQVKRG